MAFGTYSERGHLISISNLTGLSDCAPASTSGKVRKVKIEGSQARVTVKNGETEETFDVPLERLKPEDRTSIFKHLTRKLVKLRVAGYRCNPEDPITAFSIDRIF